MNSPTEIVVLQTTALPQAAEAALGRRFTLVPLPEDGAERQAVLAQYGEKARAIAGSGKGKVDTELLAALPRLEIISVTSAGLDAIDTEAVAARGIPIFNTSTVLADDVADLALWLVLGTTRNLNNADRFVREGGWLTTHQFPLGKTITGMRIGILGLGHIGKAIARRLEVLGATLGYTGRSRKPDSPYEYFSDLEHLAKWSDLLVVSCASTPETYRLVDAEILRALGPEGIVVNISRGNIIDESALIEALDKGTILRAGLDVFEDEPHVPQALIESDRTILLPHIGSATDGTRARMWQAMVDALIGHFSLPAADWRTET